MPGSGSQAAASDIAHGFAGRGDSDLTLVVVGPAAQARAALAKIDADPRLEVASAGPVSVHGSTYAQPLGLAMDDGAARRELPGLQSSLAAASPGVRLALVSAASFFGEVNTLSQRDLVLAELATLPVIALVLLLLYRSVAAAVVSFVAGGTAIVLTFGLLSLLARHYQLSVFAENAASMIGLGVSIDYSLFIISRYRSERDQEERGRAERTTATRNASALATALRTSGHTVLFSGVIVASASSALFLIDLNVIQSIALAIVIVTVFAVLASLVVLPAVLLVIGDRIEWGRLARRSSAASVPAGVRAVAAAHGGVVGGETAEGVDANSAISARLPLVAGVMLAVIYVLLLLTFRALLLPLKAIVVNVLSVAATYGILVLLFARNGGYLQNFVPSLLLAVLFSLSTDYEVFLLSRVREEYQRLGDNAAAVAAGLARTAPLITGAAALMIVVFAGFGFIGLMPMRQLGTGLAFAVALDATVIRLIIVPAFMRLAGRWNWWFPGPRPRSPQLEAGVR